ncbi:RNA 2',3'-cyclic phosphodiesterase [Candidatus Woesearchaeota archaeon]|nr:RNA 2',3'-cyclic phosphodiesterase [Candidatus Woesearchaeota archaeon]
MRVFIAAELPQETVQQVKKIQHAVRQLPGTQTCTQHFHLTFLFLGEQQPHRVKEIGQALSSLHFSPLTCHIRSSGTFEYKGQPRVTFLKVEPQEPLEALHEAIVTLTRFTHEFNHFSPHITLSRVKNAPDEFKTQFAQIPLPLISFVINKIVLFQSIREPLGHVYKRLFTVEAHD